MNNRGRWLLLGTAVLCLTSCGGTPSDYYTDDAPLTLSLSSSHLRIMQITDLHLTYGIDYHDRQTLRLIEDMAELVEPDLIVVTGDIAMAPTGPSLFKTFYRRMERLQIPWTFVFGNHETDFDDYTRYIDLIDDPQYLLFKTGPEITTGSYGNFIIQTEVSGNSFMNLYMMDSRTENENTLSGYDYMTLEQVNWYRTHAQQDSLDGLTSLAFMHMPIVQYGNYDDVEPNIPFLDGVMEEGMICYQGVDTGFFDAMVDYGMTKGVFVGHDHNNSFSFMKDGILLAYGQTTGYNGYGFLERGARIIDVDSSHVMSSYLLLESEL